MVIDSMLQSRKKQFKGITKVNKLVVTLLTTLFVVACGGSGGGDGGSPTPNNAPIDEEMTISAIAGDGAITIGESKQYTVAITDADGIQSISIQLLNALAGLPVGSISPVVKDLPYTNVGNLFTITLDATGLSPGNHTVLVKATGVDGGRGDNSTEREVTKGIAVNAVDAELSISAITGDDGITVGETKYYSVTIADSDGVLSHSIELKNSINTIVQIFSASKAGDVYSISFDSTGLAPGSYSLVAKATGVDGGVGNNSTQKIVNKVITVIPPVDAALSVSAIIGNLSVVTGTVTDYTAIISDINGIQSVIGTLKNSSNSVVKALAQAHTGSTYTFTLDSTGLASGNYTVEIAAIGVDGGTGDNSGLTIKSLPVTLSLLPNVTKFRAWVGATDTNVTFDNAPNGAEFYSSRESDCDIANYASCNSGQLNMLDGNTFTDTAFTLSNTAYYQLKNSTKKSVMNSHSVNYGFDDRSGHQLIEFKNKLWIIGGRDYVPKNDVWSSIDGVTWQQETAAAGFTPRTNHQSIVFNNKIWVIGGEHRELGFNSKKNDVWSSVDGVTWQQETAAAGFSPRYGHQSAVFNSKLWVIGGYDGNRKNDVWSSVDGVTWQQEIAAAGFAPRSFHRSVVFNNKLWVIGGYDGNRKNDVWSSVDGVAWQQETATAGFTSRSGHQSVVFNNRLWVIGGYDDSARSDVWSSVDGIAWQQETATAGFTPRSGHQSVVFNNKLWVIGGYDDSARSDVWSSSDGVTWQDKSSSAGFGKRKGHQSLVFNNKLWLIGGENYNGDHKNDVWSSSDGITWQQETAAAGFYPRSGHQSVVFNNKLWVIGGDTGGQAYLNDVWSSSDGITWKEEVSYADFRPRYGHQSIVFNNKLWVVGGYDGYPKNDVWSSVDGITWQQKTAAAGFAVRTNHQSLVFDNRLWVIGGHDEDFGLDNKNDVWSSVDGVTWQQETAAADFSPRYDHQSVVFNNKLWVLGGFYIGMSGGKSDVWSSSDGITWQQEADSVNIFGPFFHQSLAFNNKLWVIGGRKGDVWSSEDGVNWRLGYKGEINSSVEP